MTEGGGRERDPLSRWVIAHPLAAGLLTLAVIAVGVWARMGRYE